MPIKKIKISNKYQLLKLIAKPALLTMTPNRIPTPKGIVVGLLLGVQVFRVFQTSWEIKRLRKDIDYLRKEQIQLAQQAAAEAAASVRHEKTVLDINPESQTRTPL